MKKVRMPANFACLIGIGIIACSFSASAGVKDFLPLQLKTKWTYQVFRQNGIALEHGRKTIEIFDTVTINNSKMYITLVQNRFR